MLIAVNFVLCLILVLLSLFRVCSMTPDTRRTIVYANAFMGAGAFAAAIGPLVWKMPVHPALLLMEAGYVSFLLACQRVWNDGPPVEFRRGVRQPNHR